MLSIRLHFSTILPLIVLFFPKTVLHADSPLLPSTPLRYQTVSPIYSRDGRIVVRAPSTRSSYRGPILIFTERTRKALERITGLSFSSEHGTLEILVGNKNDGDTRVQITHFRDSYSGECRERIGLPDPEHVDLTRLRYAICDALLRIWICDASFAATPPPHPAPPPAWLSVGLFRQMSREKRQADLDRTLLLWSQACLPPAPILYSEKSEAASREVAVASFLAGTLLDKGKDGFPLENCLRKLAKGERWSPEWLAPLFSEEREGCDLDLALDLIMLKAWRLVIIPGVTTEGIVRRFRSSLLLYPPLSAKLSFPYLWGMDFKTLIRQVPGNPVLRLSALQHAKEIKLMSAGRDKTLIEVANRYAAFLLAVASGKESEILEKLLSDAESQRKGLEQMTAKGELLKTLSE